MATRLVQVNFKAHDDVALGGFWAAALGWGMEHEAPGVTNLEPPDYTYPDPVAVCIDLVASAEPKVGKNRVHLDLAARSAEHQAEIVARLEGLGATRVDVGQGPDVPWVVMADPEGNELCVLDSLYDETGPIGCVAVDCADPRAMVDFWGRATDWTVRKETDEVAFLRSAQDVGPYLGFVRSPDPKQGWNRVHLDVRPYPDDDVEAEEQRLLALGATTRDLGGADVHWTVLADPEGNEFCLLAPG
jgi:predicted enzyme related to lactoylglutathione lyase